MGDRERKDRGRREKKKAEKEKGREKRRETGSHAVSQDLRYAEWRLDELYEVVKDQEKVVRHLEVRHVYVLTTRS